MTSVQTAWDGALHSAFFVNPLNVTEVKHAMRYMVHIEISPEAGNKLDFEEGGPGAIIKYLAERFKPEMFYVTTIRRAMWMVMDLNESTDGGTHARRFKEVRKLPLVHARHPRS